MTLSKGTHQSQSEGQRPPPLDRGWQARQDLRPIIHLGDASTRSHTQRGAFIRLTQPLHLPSRVQMAAVGFERPQPPRVQEWLPRAWQYHAIGGQRTRAPAGPTAPAAAQCCSRRRRGGLRGGRGRPGPGCRQPEAAEQARCARQTLRRPRGHRPLRRSAEVWLARVRSRPGAGGRSGRWRSRCAGAWRGASRGI